MAENDKEPTEKEEAIDMVSRRDFLKIVGASFAAMSAAGCKLRAPKEKIIPYLEQTEESVPGLARWYASTCSGCSAACGVLVKNRDGRPIKLEGNPDHPLSKGGLCARGQATVLDLYDSERLPAPLFQGATTSWSNADYRIGTGLNKIGDSGGNIRLLTSTLTSPSEMEAVSIFLKRYPSARHVTYDALSGSAIREAHLRTHGRAMLPHYHFNRARTIVSFDADFLGTWISPVEFTKDYSANREPSKPGNERDVMSWHAQFESRMSLTGANADLRVPILPSQQLATVAALGRLIADRVGWHGTLPDLTEGSGVNWDLLNQTADMLYQAKGRSLVISGSEDAAIQILINWINEMLGNYGATVDIQNPSLQRQGDDAAMRLLTDEMTAGKIAALLVYNCNPAYSFSGADQFKQALTKVGLTISLSERKDETAALAQYICPVPHPLEAWSDASPCAGVWSLYQPTLSPLFDSRPALESLLQWAGQPMKSYDFIREIWRGNVFSKQKEFSSFSAFWDAVVRRGAVTVQTKPPSVPSFDSKSLIGLKPLRRRASSGEFELVSYPSVALADGRQANNPWLQELPDPVTRVSWGNYASFSPADAEELHVSEGQVVRMSASGRSVALPAHIQPGMTEGVVAAALGYGRKNAGKIAANYPMVKMFSVEKDLLAGADLYPLSEFGSVSVQVTGRMSPLAKVQMYDFLSDPITGQKRPFLQEMTLQEYSRDPKVEGLETPETNGLWPRHEYKGHKWGMAINLNSCTGCGGCVVACQAENNVPIVGKAEVRKSRDMAWLRIDRYYNGAPDTVSPNPDVAFQPMLCQHCDNAPCETVCPVLATVHSSEGLNMQVYNRCVGTRYCANNCPYKVRRFNWFDYSHQDLLQNLALNPDVTVRSRGVMEKCSFCVQRVYSAKFDADSKGKTMKDGDVKSACMQSCPADAIVFGDLNDPDSRVAQLAKEPRTYRVLAELGVGPSVFYQAKVRNKKV